MNNKEIDQNHRITVTKGMSGFFAIHIADISEDGGRSWYTDIIDTGMGRYRTSEEAWEEARDWAEAEQMELVRP